MGLPSLPAEVPGSFSLLLPGLKPCGARADGKAKPVTASRPARSPHKEPMGRVRTSAIGTLRWAILWAFALLTFVGGVALWGLHTQTRSLDVLTRGAIERLVCLGEAREGAAELEIGYLRFLESLDLDLSAPLEALGRVKRALESCPVPEGGPLGPEVAVLLQEAEALGRLTPSGDVPLERIRSLNARIDRLFRRTETATRQQGQAALVQARTIRLWVGAGVAGGWVVLIAASLYAVRGIQEPFNRVLGFLEAASRGDLSHPLEGREGTELGALARAAATLGQTLVEWLRSLAGVAAELEARSRSLGEEAQRAHRRAEEGAQRAQQGILTARDLEETSDTLSEQAARLREESERTASGVQQVLAMTQQMRAEMEGLCHRVESSTGAMDDLSQASTQVAALAEQVGSAARSVGASASAIEDVTRALRSGAREGRELTANVVERSQEGLASMRSALEAMERIREAVDTAVSRFERLDGELQRVGRVLEVIDEVAGRTNLLSLNAAIIAAQAGEKGNAFAVVANEIRSLAEQTASNTREIRAIVDGLLTGGQEASEAIAEGAERVAEGEAQARETAELLQAIHESADHAAGRLREIETAGEAQAREAEQVAREILQVGQGVAGIVEAVKDQERRAHEVLENLEEMERVARQTVEAADEQTSGTETITRSAVEVSQVSEALDGAVQEMRSALRGLREELEALGRQALEDQERVGRLEVEGESLAELAADLHHRIASYRLPPEPAQADA